MASDEPVVAVPIAASRRPSSSMLVLGAFHRFDRIEMQRVWIEIVAGYSSWSHKLIPIVSTISLVASSGIHVWTYEARFRPGLPSSRSSLLSKWYVERSERPFSGRWYFGMGFVP